MTDQPNEYYCPKCNETYHLSGKSQNKHCTCGCELFRTGKTEDLFPWLKEKEQK